MRKTLYFESSSGYGGSSCALANLINVLNRDAFYPIVAMKNKGPQFEKIKQAKFIKLRSYKEIDKLANFRFCLHFLRNILPETIKIYFYLKSNEISLVHINTNIMSGISAIITAKIAGVSCICHIRQTRKLIKRERIFARWVDMFILINNEAYEVYKQDIPKEKLLVVYDGIDLQEFLDVESGNLREEFNINSSSIVGFTGRIVKGKGQKEFILSAKEVLKIKPNVKFIIVGDAKGGSDRYYKEVKQLVKNEGLEESVIFTGWRNDIKNVISSFDILIQGTTTFPEGLPNIIIEAMALGKPVIATSVPGPNEIVLDNQTGFLVPPGDIDAMAEKIIYLLEHPEIARKMGEEGRKRVEEHFNIRNTVKKIEAVYEEVLSKRENFLTKAFYNIQRIVDYVIYPLQVMYMYIEVRKRAFRTIKEINDLKTGRYVSLGDFIVDKSQCGQIKKILKKKKEFLIGDIDQDGRLLSSVGKTLFIDIVPQNNFIVRGRYNLQVVTLNINGNYVIAVKKHFGKERLNFIKEAFILQKLSSCNIPCLLKVAWTENIIYMTFIPGISMRDALWTKGAKVRDGDYAGLKRNENVPYSEIKKMKLDEAKRFIPQVVNDTFIKNVNYRINDIHSKGIILEDIKYGNILIGRDGEPYFVDFHAAKIVKNIRSLKHRYLVEEEKKALNDLLNGHNSGVITC